MLWTYFFEGIFSFSMSLPQATYRNRIVSQNLSTRDRKIMHTPTEDHFRSPAADQTSPYKSKACQLPSLCLSSLLKDKELVEVIKHSRGTYETLTSEVTQNLRATVGQNSMKPTAKTEGLATFSEKPKDQAAAARPKKERRKNIYLFNKKKVPG